MIRTLLILLFLTLPAFSQFVIGLNQERVIFDGGTLWVMEVGAAAAIRVEVDASGKASKRIQAPRNTHIIDRLDGFLWACRREAGPEGPTLRIQSSTDGLHWIEEAYFLSTGRDHLFRIFPLSREWYLLEFLMPRGLGDQTSLWAFAKADNSNRLRITKLMDMELPTPLVTAKPKAKDGWTLEDEVPVNSLNPAFRGIAADFVARCPDGLIFASGHTGFIWIVTLKESGPTSRIVQLFPTVVPMMKEARDLVEWSILGLQPMPDGSVMIASRSETAVLFARIEDAPMRSLSDFKDSLFMQKRERNMKNSITKYPDILWWKLDPQTGTLHKIEAPMNIPSRFEGPAMASKFRFRPKLDGNLLAFY